MVRTSASQKTTGEPLLIEIGAVVGSTRCEQTNVTCGTERFQTLRKILRVV